jgi:non-heme Fe2+,alpha-ketoglutarate-dependent halogenase
MIAADVWRASMTRLAALRASAGASVRKRLTATQVAEFDRDGFLVPMMGCSASHAQGILERIERQEEAEQKAGMALFLNAHVQHRWWYDLCTRPQILDVVQDVLGPNLLIWKSQLWIKEAGSGSYVGWHQDATYWGLDPPESVNVWMALTDVTPSHGPLQLLAGSHAEALPTSDTYDVGNLLTRGQDVDWEAAGGLPTSRIHEAVLKPGEFSVHHLCTAHASQPNAGPGRRVGFNVTFVAPSVAPIRADGASAMLVRGSDDYGHFNLETPPSADVPTAAEVRAVHEKNEAVSRNLLAGANMDRFIEVSQQRAVRNLPKHVGSHAAGGEGAFGASIASQLEEPTERR